MKNNPFSLEGKTILVTGASSGIGERTAIECSNLGATLIVTGRNKDRLEATLHKLGGDGHKAVIADLITDEGKKAIVDGVKSIDGLVLCAGQGGMAPFKLASRKRMAPCFEINYFAPVELLRMLVGAKKLNNNASVVFVSSIGGIKDFSTGNTIYGATKAALNSTMQFCAKELAHKGVRCNSVLPGMVNTSLIKNGSLSEEQHKADMEKYPLKRYGEPEDIAYGIIYLLSDAASWVTGHSLVIDGGITI